MWEGGSGGCGVCSPACPGLAVAPALDPPLYVSSHLTSGRGRLTCGASSHRAGPQLPDAELQPADAPPAVCRAAAAVRDHRRHRLGRRAAGGGDRWRGRADDPESRRSEHRGPLRLRGRVRAAACAPPLVCESTSRALSSRALQTGERLRSLVWVFRLPEGAHSRALLLGLVCRASEGWCGFFLDDEKRAWQEPLPPAPPLPPCLGPRIHVVISPLVCSARRSGLTNRAALRSARAGASSSSAASLSAASPPICSTRLQRPTNAWRQSLPSWGSHCALLWLRRRAVAGTDRSPPRMTHTRGGSGRERAPRAPPCGRRDTRERERAGWRSGGARAGAAGTLIVVRARCAPRVRDWVSIRCCACTSYTREKGKTKGGRHATPADAARRCRARMAIWLMGRALPLGDTR